MPAPFSVHPLAAFHDSPLPARLIYCLFLPPLFSLPGLLFLFPPWLPVFLLSCDDTGAMQLRLMSVPNYRQRLTQAALKAQYRPPPEDLPSLDALFQGMPFVMAADMDLRRIDTALKTAYERGYSQIAVAALEGQAETVLFARYRDTGRARVFILTKAALTEVLGEPLQLHAPSRKQFLTEKGEVVDAPLIQADRKTGGPH